MMVGETTLQSFSYNGKIPLLIFYFEKFLEVKMKKKGQNRISFPRIDKPKKKTEKKQPANGKKNSPKLMILWDRPITFSHVFFIPSLISLLQFFFFLQPVLISSHWGGALIRLLSLSVSFSFCSFVLCVCSSFNCSQQNHLWGESGKDKGCWKQEKTRLRKREMKTKE
jgi:hypothetical protein